MFIFRLLLVSCSCFSFVGFRACFASPCLPSDPASENPANLCPNTPANAKNVLQQDSRSTGYFGNPQNSKPSPVSLSSPPGSFWTEIRAGQTNSTITNSSGKTLLLSPQVR